MTQDLRQEAYGPHHSHEKQFQSINIFSQSYFDYTVMFVREIEKTETLSLILRIEWCIFVESQIPSPRDALCQVGFKLAE